MYGIYAWNAGATGAAIVSDLVALANNGEVSSLSSACNKAATSKAGAPSPWVSHDSGYGVLKAPCVGGGPASDKLARLTVDTSIKLMTMNAWDAVVHSAGDSTSQRQVSLAISSAGSVHFIFTDAAFFIASSDFSYWQMVAEVKRAGPLLSDVSMPSWVQVGNDGYTYSPRIKKTSQAGYSVGATVETVSPYGTLTSSATRDLAENLYIPMVPAVAVTSSVPYGEYVGLMAVGGYGQAGDYMQDGDGKQWVLGKYGYYLTLAVERR